jgi:tRNA (Thr-GGU) A37 N-methylase
MGKLPEVILYSPIGVIRSPLKDIEGMPIQPTAAKGIRGTVEIKKKDADGLKAL